MSLSAPSTNKVTFRFWTEDFTAKPGSDFQPQVGEATIPAGANNTIVLVPVFGDLSTEPNESLRLNIDFPINATIVRPQAEGTILDDDSAFSLVVGVF